MNNQVAINFLDQVREILLDDKSWLESTEQSINEAFDMAISALREKNLQPTCNQLATDTISRQAAIDKFKPWLSVKGFSEGELNMLKVVLYELRCLPSVQPEQRWIPCSERLPNRAEDGCSNWHTNPVTVCIYGNGWDWKEFDYEILTGIFIEYEDEETGEKDLCFKPDRITTFLPDEFDFVPLDGEFKYHFPKDECMYYEDDDITVKYHDRFFEILAWMPLPEPYKAERREDESD